MKRSILVTVGLAFCWMALTGSFTGADLLLGFAVGYGVMRLAGPLIGTTFYITRLWHLLELSFFFLKELVRASVRILIDVVTPRHKMEPGVIAIPLDVESSAEITVLANLISLTPGTLSLDVSEDRSTLFVHAMYVRGRDVEAERARIKRTLERRVRLTFGRNA